MFTLTGESHNQKLPSVAQTGANKMPQVQLSTLNTSPVVFKSGATSLTGNLVSIEVKRPRSKVYDTFAIPLSKVLQFAEGDADVGFVVHTPINAEDGGEYYEGELDSIPDENGYVTLTDVNGTEIKILESLVGSITVVETEEEEEEAPKAKSKSKAAPAKKAKKVVDEDEEDEEEEEEAPKAKSKAKAAPAKKAKKVVDEDEDDEDFDDEDFDDEDEEDEAPKAKTKSKAKAAPAKKAKKVVDEDEDEDDDEDFEFDDEDE